MSYPHQPSPWDRPAAQPGLYPLRPLGVGEILTTAIRVAWANLALLLPVGLLVSLLSTGVQLAVLSATGNLAALANGTLFAVPTKPTNADVDRLGASLGHFVLAVGASSLVMLVLTPVLVGLAASGAATAATRTGTDLAGVVRRLRGRWVALILTSLLVFACVLGGLVLLIVPGLILTIALIPAAPAAAIEGARPVAAVKRALWLSKGSRWRLFGVILLAGLFAGIGGAVVGAVIGGVVGHSGSVSSYVTVQLVIAALTGVVSAWSGTVNALLYIDLRLRKEGLGQALAASA